MGISSRSLCKYLQVLLCGLVSVYGAAATAQELAPVKVAPPQVPPAVRTMPGSGAVGVRSVKPDVDVDRVWAQPKAASGAVAAVTARATGAVVPVISSVARAAAMAQLSAGTMSAQALWHQGALGADDVLMILQSPERLAPDERNETLQGDLAGLLVRVALSRYYSRVGDERAVRLCEALLKELDRKLAADEKASPWPQLWAIVLLAQYYQGVEMWQLEGQT